jgi:hypothetical protein
MAFRSSFASLRDLSPSQDISRRIGVLDNDALTIIRQPSQEFVEALVKILSTKVIFCTIWLSVGQQR